MRHLLRLIRSVAGGRIGRGFATEGVEALGSRTAQQMSDPIQVSDMIKPIIISGRHMWFIMGGIAAGIATIIKFGQSSFERQDASLARAQNGLDATNAMLASAQNRLDSTNTRLDMEIEMIHAMREDQAAMREDQAAMRKEQAAMRKKAVDNFNRIDTIFRRIEVQFENLNENPPSSPTRSQ